MIPFAASACDQEMPSFPVRNYDDPWVAVIIPVGPEHTNGEICRAIDSVWTQSFPYWELIVVNDSGEQLVQHSTGRPLEEAYPYIKLLQAPGGNVAIARNMGAAVASAPFLVWLDADDWLEMNYLAKVIDAYNHHPDNYIYTDWLAYNGKTTKHQARSFDCEKLKLEAIHAVTALVPKVWHMAVGGFDEELGDKGWEDWDYYLKIVLQEGHCGYRVPEALMTYDATSGSRRDKSFDRRAELIPIIHGRYSDMGCRGCKDKKTTSPTPVGVVGVSVAQTGAQAVMMPSTTRGRSVPMPTGGRTAAGGAGDSNMVTVIENSGNAGSHGVIGAITRTKYGRKKHGDRFQMHIRDATAQPHMYVIVEGVGSGVGSDVPANIPTKPQAPVDVVVSRPQPAPVPTKPQAPVDVVASRPQPVPIRPPVPVLVADAEPAEETLAPYSVDADGIDIALLTLNQIKSLGLDAEEAAAAYEEEVMGQGRKTVLTYLEGIAGDELEIIYED